MPTPTPELACGCFKQCKIDVCAETFTFLTDLVDTEIRIEITDKFGQKYIQNVTTDSDGVAEFDLTVDLPKPWNEHTGVFTLQVFDPTVSGCEPVLFTRGDFYYYECLTIEFEKQFTYVPAP